MVNINISLPPDTHKKLRLAAVMEGMTIKELLARILETEARETTTEYNE